MRQIGYGAGYAYDHDEPDAFSGQDYWPDALGRQTFYEPTERGFEREIRKRLDWWAKLRRERREGEWSPARSCDERKRRLRGSKRLASRLPRRRPRRRSCATPSIVGCARAFGAGVSLWHALAVNVVGSFAMGLLAGWLAVKAGEGWSAARALFVATGLLGGFTTFSAFSLDAVVLWERGEAGAAAAYGLASVALSIGGLVAGLAIVRVAHVLIAGADRDLRSRP